MSSDPNEVLVIAFDDVNKAESVLQELQQLNKEHTLQLGNAAVIINDAQGKLTIKQTTPVSPKQGAVVGALAGGLLGLASTHIQPIENAAGGHLNSVEAGTLGALIGTAGGLIVSKAIDPGFKEDYLKEIAANLQPGSSAIVAIVHDIHVDQAIAELQVHGGKILRHTLPDDVTARLAAAVQ